MGTKRIPLLEGLRANIECSVALFVAAGCPLNQNYYQISER